MINQQIYHVYFGHNGREYCELGHSFQAPNKIIKKAVTLCSIGTPDGSVLEHPILLSYPDNATDYLYMICCSSMNDFSNRSALFFHVLACSLDNAKKFGINAFSMYDAGYFVTNYQPGNELNTAPISCDKQSFEPGTAPFVLMLSENDKPVVLKANEPGQLVRSLLTDETVNRLKWAEFAYKELPGFGLYVMSNPDLDSKDYIVRDANGKVLSNLDDLSVSDKPMSDQSDSKSAVSIASSEKNKQKNNGFANYISYAMVFALALLISYVAMQVASDINSLKNDIAALKRKISQMEKDSKHESVDYNNLTPNPTEVYVTRSEILALINSEINEKLAKVDYSSLKRDIMADVRKNYVSTEDFNAYKKEKSSWWPTSDNNKQNDSISPIKPETSQIPSTSFYQNVTLGIQLIAGNVVVNNESQIDVKIDNIRQSLKRNQNGWLFYEIPLKKNTRDFFVNGIHCRITINNQRISELIYYDNRARHFSFSQDANGFYFVDFNDNQRLIISPNIEVH